jgi:hypothetical protein
MGEEWRRWHGEGDGTADPANERLSRETSRLLTIVPSQLGRVAFSAFTWKDGHSQVAPSYSEERFRRYWRVNVAGKNYASSETVFDLD